MNAREAASAVIPALAAAGIPEPAFEAELLVRSAGRLSRSQYFAGAPFESGAELAEVLARRLTREPAAYISGWREFHGHPFAVSPAVLIPRPESELLVELALRETRAGDTVVDVGTGCGCIAISVALALPLGHHARVIGTDLRAPALALATLNARTLGARVSIVHGDLLGAFRHADVVLANLPYIPTQEIDALEPEVSRWEPRVALDGGSQGYTVIERLIADCAGRLRPRVLALEVGFGQARDVAAIAVATDATVAVIPDLSGIERVVVVRWA